MDIESVSTSEAHGGVSVNRGGPKHSALYSAGAVYGHDDAVEGSDPPKVRYLVTALKPEHGSPLFGRRRMLHDVDSSPVGHAPGACQLAGAPSC